MLNAKFNEPTKQSEKLSAARKLLMSVPRVGRIIADILSICRSEPRKEGTLVRPCTSWCAS